MLRSSGVEALLKGKYNLTYYFQYLWHALLYCSQINRSFIVCVIVHKSIDCTRKWWLFMRLYECMMQRCMFTALRNWMPQRVYVCMYDECMLCLRIYRLKCHNAIMYTCTTNVYSCLWDCQSKRLNARMYVCMYVCEKVRLWFFSNQMPQRVLLWNPRICLWQMMYVQCFRCHRQDCNSDNLYGQYSLRFSSLLCF